MKLGLWLTVLCLLMLSSVAFIRVLPDGDQYTGKARRDRWISYCTDSEFTAKQCDVLFAVKTREER